MDKIAKKIEISMKISASLSREECCCQELAQLLNREETWDEDDVRQAKNLEKEIAVEKQIQRQLREDMAKIDQEGI